MIRCPLTARKTIVSNSRIYLRSIIMVVGSVDLVYIGAPLDGPNLT